MPRKKVAKPAQKSVDLAETISGFYDDPLGFVLFAFPWGQSGAVLHDQDGPDRWQTQLLAQLGDAVREQKREKLEAVRFAISSGNGVGKTALVSWIVIWFVSTRSSPQVVVTANTAMQLNTKTWRELAKWHRLAINKDWFQWTATKFYLKDRPEDWFAVAQPWSKERAEAFAGTHEKDVLLLFDEASAIDDLVWEIAEGAMTTSGAMWLAFGNPTRNTGRFRECWRQYRHRWRTMQVDGRNAKMANKPQIDQWINDYGEDSDFVRVRVKGEFPRSASNQLIAEDLVYDAAQRGRALGLHLSWEQAERAMSSPALDDHRAANMAMPRIMAVDVARFGDDQSVIGLRQGWHFRILAAHRELDGHQLANRVGEWIDEIDPDAVFVDEVGVGASVVDQLGRLGYEVIPCNGALKATDDRLYYNKRAEVWVAVRDWLKRGGAIPDVQELRDDLTSPEYGFDNKDRYQLESKEDMKARGLLSPDLGDCLAMTFFAPVARRTPQHQIREMVRAKMERRGSWMAV